MHSVCKRLREREGEKKSLFCPDETDYFSDKKIHMYKMCKKDQVR